MVTSGSPYKRNGPRSTGNATLDIHPVAPHSYTTYEYSSYAKNPGSVPQAFCRQPFIAAVR